MLSSTTYVHIPATGLVIPLADAKLHLRVDDVEPGVKAESVIGTGDAAIKLVAKLTGERGNDLTIELVEDGVNTPLGAVMEADAITVNLATDALSLAVSSANDVIATLVSVPAIAQRFDVTAHEGTGTGLMEATSPMPFEGGVDGTSAEDSLITNLILTAQRQAETILRRSLLDQTLIHKRNGFPPCRQFVLERGPVREVTVTYLDENGATQTLDNALYSEHFESIPEYIELVPGASWPATQNEVSRSVSVEMKCGHLTETDVASEIQQAIRLMIGYWYSVRENVMVGPGMTSLAVPQGAEWLMWPYRDVRF